MPALAISGADVVAELASIDMISTIVKITPVMMLLSSDAHRAGPLHAAGGGGRGRRA